MSLELEALGRVAVELMDELSDELGGEPAARVDGVMIVVALSTDEWSHVRYRCSDRRPWIHRALLVEALDLANEPDPHDGDDD